MKTIRYAVVLAALCCCTILYAQTRVACIGNSITEGAGLQDPATQAYPARLQSLLGTGYDVQNDGVSSTTMLKAGDIPYWTKGKLPQTLAFVPTIVTVMLGTNDTKPQNWDAFNGEFKRDYLAMIDTLNTVPGKPKIYPVLPAPIMPNGFEIRDSALQKIIVIVKQIALERGLTVIDCNSPLVPFPSYFIDGVHPNAIGADTIAHVLYRVISASLVNQRESGSVHRKLLADGISGASSFVPVFQGCNSGVVLAMLVPGKRYEIKMYTAKGLLVLRRIVGGSQPESILGSLKSTPALRWVSVRALQ
jgi:lysophospholipase L1-like esterase